jgi:hypothetical protein
MLKVFVEGVELGVAPVDVPLLTADLQVNLKHGIDSCDFALMTVEK